jgi:hypothetical protein
MKLSKEYTIILIIGLFLLSYVLEAVVDPLQIELATPYAFLNPEQLAKYPFSSTVIFIRALAFFILPLWLYAFFPRGYFAKGSILIVIGALMQLYSLQEIATHTTLAPLEWSLSLSTAGIALIIPAIIYFLRGLLYSLTHKTSTNHQESSDTDSETENTETQYKY